MIKGPSEFKRAFTSLVQSAGDVIASGTSPAASLEDAECCFALTARHERPLEYLQCLLDLLLVTFEPNPLGSFQLNSNWDFVTESVPEEPFELGYVSVVGNPGEAVEDLARTLRCR